MYQDSFEKVWNYPNIGMNLSGVKTRSTILFRFYLPVKSCWWVSSHRMCFQSYNDVILSWTTKLIENFPYIFGQTRRELNHRTQNVLLHSNFFSSLSRGGSKIMNYGSLSQKILNRKPRFRAGTQMEQSGTQVARTKHYFRLRNRE